MSCGVWKSHAKTVTFASVPRVAVSYFLETAVILTIQMPGVYQRSYKTVWGANPLLRPWSSAASESIGTRRKGSDGYTATKGSKREGHIVN
jgi:hypothetical protein